jgi:ABC-type branched-subunit amino acid transport system ATPase component
MSLSVPAERVVGFLGPNGAGKTTAMRAVLGVIGLDSGEIRLRRARRRLGTSRALWLHARGTGPVPVVGARLAATVYERSILRTGARISIREVLRSP